MKLVGKVYGITLVSDKGGKVAISLHSNLDVEGEIFLEVSNISNPKFFDELKKYAENSKMLSIELKEVKP